MASLSLVRLLVLCLLCVTSLAEKRRYLSVSMDDLMSSSKAHLDCPPSKKSVATSGNKLTIPASCGIPKCCGAGESIGRHLINHDINRLTTLLQRSSASSPAPAPLKSPVPRIPFPFPQAPSPHGPIPWIPPIRPVPPERSPLLGISFPFPPSPSTRPFPGIPFPFSPAPSARPFPGIPFPFSPTPSEVSFPSAQAPRALSIPRIPVAPAPRTHRPLPIGPFPFPFPLAPSAHRPLPIGPFPFPFPPAPSAHRPLPKGPFPFPFPPAPSAHRPLPIGPFPFPFPPAPSTQRPLPKGPFPFPPAPSAHRPLPIGPFPFPFPPAPSAHRPLPIGPFPFPPAPSARGVPFPFPPISISPAPPAVPPTTIPFSFPPISVSPVAPPAEAPAVTIPDSSGAYLDTLEFVVTVGFGTPAHTYAVMFDTGSDLSWIQCRPCSGHCYKQHDPIFDPSKSSTYAAVPCGNPECKAAGGKCDTNGTCIYTVGYGDGSSTSGVLSHETLSLTSSSALHGFVFGCGEKNLGSYGDVDGLIGLGRGKFSLASQAAPSLGATFSYCLPSHNGTKGYLTIGSTPVSNKAVYTAMVQKPAELSTFYFVELVSIDIGGYILPVPSTVFTNSGTLLDSGTILTYLPEEAYTALRDRFRFTMKQYKPAPAQDVLDTCYDFTGQPAIFAPAVSFKFSDGAVFDLDFFGVLLFPDDSVAVGCLAFAPRPPKMPFNIIGNTQQRSAEVIYDVAAEKIGFVPASC